MAHRVRNDLDVSADLLQQGRHGDPFAVLGPHEVGGRTVVRTFQPGIVAAALVAADGQLLAEARRIGSTDLFEAQGSRRHYRWRLTRHDGTSWEIEDPYRFSSLLGDLDRHLMAKGEHELLYEELGAHRAELDGIDGVQFAVWAPNALRVSVVGDFNDWDGRRHVMRRHPSVGVWDIFLPGIGDGAVYKYELLDAAGEMLVLKSDPLAFRCEQPPGNASIVFASEYLWQDDAWRAARGQSLSLDAPVSIYEVHLGSWRRGDDGRSLSYRELADQLIPYVCELGFTHLELMPVSEHPFAGSWGYQPTALYAPGSRLGTPDDFKYFVDCCHRHGLGVIVDWVGAHFPSDPHGLARFDGTALYEHEDPRRGRHVEWDTLIYNYGRSEVANFLIANALFWIREYHVDALRVDAVASMLYLDYSRAPGDWLPNEHGGNENLEAIAFLRRLNELVHADGGVTFAEESTAWAGVSRPTWCGGLGFTYKWNMGWMNDTLTYMSEDPVHRKYHHDRMTFNLVYAFTENFVLPLSHDEVVHGKGSLIGKMSGDEWQRFANLRAYLAFMYAQPGKKLLFMGAEFAQLDEWNHDSSLDWHLLGREAHAGISRLVGDLNRLYREIRALHEVDFEHAGFRWIECEDRESSILAWLRYDRDGGCVICVTNFTPVVRESYRIDVPSAGLYREVLNTDAAHYGGSNVGNFGHVLAASEPHGTLPASLSLTLPPLGTLYFAREEP